MKCSGAATVFAEPTGRFRLSRFLRGHIGLHTGPWIVRIDQISLGHRPQLRGRRHDIAGNSDAASMRLDELPKLRP